MANDRIGKERVPLLRGDDISCAVRVHQQCVVVLGRVVIDIMGHLVVLTRVEEAQSMTQLVTQGLPNGRWIQESLSRGD